MALGRKEPEQRDVWPTKARMQSVYKIVTLIRIPAAWENQLLLSSGILESRSVLCFWVLRIFLLCPSLGTMGE